MAPPLNLSYRNESFNFAASAQMGKLRIWIHDHKTLGKDKLLSQGEVDVSFFLRVLCFGMVFLTSLIRSGGTYKLAE